MGIGDWAQSPIPNPQSPIPNPQSPFEECKYLNLNFLKCKIKHYFFNYFFKIYYLIIRHFFISYIIIYLICRFIQIMRFNDIINFEYHFTNLSSQLELLFFRIKSFINSLDHHIICSLF